MSITDRLEEALINARIATQMTGETRSVAISEEDALGILAMLAREARILEALNNQIDVCTELDDGGSPAVRICDAYAVAWQQTETGAWEPRCRAHLDETDETFIWRNLEEAA